MASFVDLLVVVVQLLSHVQLCMTPWTAACRAPLSSVSPGACSNSCPSSQCYHPTISSSVALFSFCLQSFPASGSFPNGLALCISWPKYWSFRCNNLSRRWMKINSICQLMLRYFVYVSLLPSLISSINISIF